MMLYDFITTAHAKWILAGEHAVLRGHGALVFPLMHYYLTLSYKISKKLLKVSFIGDLNNNISLLFIKILEYGQQLLNIPNYVFIGHVMFESNLIIGKGMGASAALSVVTARWFAYQNLIAIDDITMFARQLENFFHGKSSGLDIAGVAADNGLYFQRGESEAIEQNWQPLWYISDCGQTAMTAACIDKVKQIWSEHTDHGQSIDESMSTAVLQARAALQDATKIDLLSTAMRLAADCFQQWGLLSTALDQHMADLYDYGALAVKPTGSGGGGLVLSLWRSVPMDIAFVKLVQLF